MKESIERLKRFQEIVALYSELLYAVEIKIPNETRHQTALRYIREAESKVSSPVQGQAIKGEEAA